MTSAFTSRNRDYAGLALVCLLAGVLRLGWPGVNSFGYDEARVSLLALEMARGGQIPAVGIPSSVGIPNPPAFVWLMALPYALSRDPLVATLLIGIANVLAVAGVWSLARRSWGPWAALTAGLLYAGAPYGVFYARSIWSQDLMGPMAVLWAWSAVRAVERRSAPALALHLLLAGLAWQVHYSGAALLPATAWLLYRERRWLAASGGARARWPWLLAGIAVPVAAVTPFTIAMLRDRAQTWADVQALGERQAAWSATALLRWAEVGAGHNWEWLPLGWAWRWPAGMDAALAIAALLTSTLIVAGALSLAVRALRRGPRSAAGDDPALAGLLPLWALVPPLLFLRSSTPAYHQYMLTALPALVLLAASLARTAPSHQRRWQGPAIAALAGLIALTQGSAAGAAIHANRDQLHPGGMGTPLLYPRAAAEFLRDGTPVYGHARSDAPAFDADASALGVLLWDYPHRLVDGESVLLLPPEGEAAHLLFLFPDIPALAMAQQHARVERAVAMPRRQGEPPYTALTVTGAPVQGLMPVPDAALANGATLLGWRAERETDSIRLLACWQIGAAWTPGRYHQYTHLYAQGGTAPLQVRDIALSSGSWAAGNVVLTWVTFDAAQSVSHVDIGMYSYPELARVGVQGRAEAIRLGPFD